MLYTCWNHLKKCPSQMKHRTGATINGRFWDRIYQWIYRHNTSNWPKTNHLRAEKIACATFRREVHKIQFCKIAKNEAFWHIEVKNAGLWKSVLPCFLGPWCSDGWWSWGLLGSCVLTSCRVSVPSEVWLRHYEGVQQENHHRHFGIPQPLRMHSRLPQTIQKHEQRLVQKKVKL